MKKVIIDNKTFQTIPGYSTVKKASHWRGEIDKLLYELDELPTVNVIKKAWLSEMGSQMDTLLIEIETEVNIGEGPVRRRLQFQLEPVLIVRVNYPKNRHRREEIQEPNVSWKLFHDLLERKLAGARLGLVEIHHEFMPYIMTQLPDGSQGSFADFMDFVLEANRLNELTQLEDKRERVYKPAE